MKNSHFFPLAFAFVDRALSSFDLKKTWPLPPRSNLRSSSSPLGCLARSLSKTSASFWKVSRGVCGGKEERKERGDGDDDALTKEGGNEETHSLLLFFFNPLFFFSTTSGRPNRRRGHPGAQRRPCRLPPRRGFLTGQAR